jgi:methionine-rich copper-binding protein CopC
VAALAVLAPLPAYAHAALVGTDPRDGASLERLPDAVGLEFSEPVTRSEVVLTAPDGTRVPLDVGARDREVTATVDPDADVDQRGTWTIAYRVVSADGHPIAGTSTFSTTTGRSVAQAPVDDEAEQTFLHRHADHLWWAVGGGAVAVALILWPLLRRREEAEA